MGKGEKKKELEQLREQVEALDPERTLSPVGEAGVIPRNDPMHLAHYLNYDVLARAIGSQVYRCGGYGDEWSVIFLLNLQSMRPSIEEKASTSLGLKCTVKRRSGKLDCFWTIFRSSARGDFVEPRPA